MGWRVVICLIVLCGLGWLTAEISSSPPWVHFLNFVINPALFFVAFMYLVDPDWGRAHPRMFKRMSLGGAAALLVFAVLFLLFAEPSVEAALGPGSRPWLFLLYLFAFVGTVLFVKRLIASRFRRL